MDLPLKKINEEVFIASEDIVRFGSKQIEFIKECAIKNLRGRARICAHKESSDRLHEMLIAIRFDSYIRPHRHEKKIESFHLVEGSADIVILNDDGTIIDVIGLSPDQNFYYRLDLPYYHTLLINSPVLVIHEITNGPFDRTQSDFAAFSPSEGEPTTINYIEQLNAQVKSWKNNFQDG
jgi:cupin fold WbuC family metalloprotein